MIKARTKPSSSRADGSSQDAARNFLSWPRLEFVTATLLTLWIVLLHGLFLFHAGPLWRDEVGTVDFAAMPTLADIWHNLRYDNFPPLFVLLARAWTLAGLSSDFDFRLLGFIIGLATLAILWFSARVCGARTPVLALALYGASPLAIRVGDSMRPYGLGVALTMLTLGLVWKFVENPRPRNLSWAMVTAVLAVQSLYHNAIFIAAFSLAAWSVTLARRQWRTSAQILVIDVVAALSLLPHWANLKLGEEWIGVTKWPAQFPEVWQALLDSLHAAGSGPAWGWALALVMALAIGGRVLLPIFRLTRGGGAAPALSWNILYCAAALVAGMVFYLAFLRLFGLLPQPWYLLILLAPSAVALDTMLAAAPLSWFKAARTAVALGAVFLGGNSTVGLLQLRQSNVDYIAATLQHNAQPQDVILVSPWYYAVSLQRYYGVAGLTTLPPLDEFRIHRYDLLQEQMAAPNPIAPLLQSMEKALRSGHAVWIVGEYRNPSPAGPPPNYPPYDGQLETPIPKYRAIWLYQIGQLVKTHTVEGGVWPVRLPPGVAINPWEALPLIYFHGWKEP